MYCQAPSCDAAPSDLASHYFAPVAESLDDQREGGRRLASAGTIEVVAGPRWRPVLEDPHELPVDADIHPATVALEFPGPQSSMGAQTQVDT